MTEPVVGIHPAKARRLGTTLLRSGAELSMAAARTRSLLGSCGDDPGLARPLADVAAWATEQGLRVLATAARVEAWEAEGGRPAGVERWGAPWHEAFDDPAPAHRAAQAAAVAWAEGDTATFALLVARHGADPVFAATVLEAIGPVGLAGVLGAAYADLSGGSARGRSDAATDRLVGSLATLLTTASSVEVAPEVDRLLDALRSDGIPLTALGLLVRPGAGTDWLVAVGTAVLTWAADDLAAGGGGGRLGATSPAADALPHEWAGDLRVPLLDAVAADPVASAHLLALLPAGALLAASAELPGAGAPAAAVVRRAAEAPAADRAAAAAGAIRSIGRAGFDADVTSAIGPDTEVLYHDAALVAAVELVAPHLDALRPPGVVGGGHPPTSIPVDPLDAGRFVAAVAASDAAAEALAEATTAWLHHQLPVVTALPEPVLALRTIGATAGRITAAVEAGRCDRADVVDDDRERRAEVFGHLANLYSTFVPAPLSGITRTYRTRFVTSTIDGGVDHTSECRADLQGGEAERSAALALWLLDETWANRGANRLFTTEGGTVPPLPREVLDATGDRVLDHLDADQATALAAWAARPDVAQGLTGIDAFISAFAAAAPPR